MAQNRKRLLAIGDIHGCSHAFDRLLAAVQPKETDLLVTLGDYVDRGPDSRGVLDRVIALRKTHQCYSLLGNHEHMMLESRRDPDVLSSWLACGGNTTLTSYGIPEGAANLNEIPSHHWEFLEHGCLDWFETDHHFFVHANAAPHLPLDRQPLFHLRWEKFVQPRPHRSGKVMVCGHTRQLDGLPHNVGHAICIDTWVYGRGWLTCLDVSSGKYWQANQRGDCREGHVDGHQGVA